MLSRLAAPLALALLTAGALTASVVGLVGSGDDESSTGASSRPTTTTAPVTVPTATEDPGARTPPDPALAPFYEQELDFNDCGVARCAALEVPLDYDDPGGGSIYVSVLDLPARDPAHRRGNLVVNPGGPGGSGTGYAYGSRSSFGDPLTTVYDIVGFDPRGVALSGTFDGTHTGIDCDVDDHEDGGIDETQVDPTPDTRAEVAAYVAAWQAFGQACGARSHGVEAHASTVEVARDLDVLRAALGDAKLTYYGASYGTRIGATYADLFPDRTGRLVLDGALDLGIDEATTRLQQAAGFERALRAFVGSCVGLTAGCYLGESVDVGLGRIRDLIARLDRTPARAGCRTCLVSGEALTSSITGRLYDRTFWGSLNTLLREALVGDFATAYEDVRPREPGPDDAYDNSGDVLSVVNCLDSGSVLDPVQVAALVPAFRRASLTFGVRDAWSLLDCVGLAAQVEAAPPPVVADGRGSIGVGAAPVLVVGTTRDPATPYEWAEHLADQLASGVLVSRDGDGHTGYYSGNQCVDTAVEAYFLDGTVPEDGLDC